jgi:hypothetical protein
MNWDYLAGFFDGEGHTRCDRGHKGGLKVVWQVTNLNVEVIDEIAYFLMDRDYHPKFIPNKAKHCGVLYIQRINEVERLLKTLRPFVIVKRAQIDAVLDAIENRPNKRPEYKKGGHLKSS